MEASNTSRAVSGGSTVRWFADDVSRLGEGGRWIATRETRADLDVAVVR